MFFLFTAFQIGDQNKQNSDGRAKSGMSISVISKATMDQESNDTNPQIQNNPGNPKSGVSSQPDGLTTSCLGGKYLVFVSSRSVKMREFSFLSLYTF